MKAKPSLLRCLGARNPPNALPSPWRVKTQRIGPAIQGGQQHARVGAVGARDGRDELGASRQAQMNDPMQPAAAKIFSAPPPPAAADNNNSDDKLREGSRVTNGWAGRTSASEVARHVTSRHARPPPSPSLHSICWRPAPRKTQDPSGSVLLVVVPTPARFLTRRGTGTATPVLFTRARDADADAHRPCLAPCTAPPATEPPSCALSFCGLGCVLSNPWRLRSVMIDYYASGVVVGTAHCRDPLLRLRASMHALRHPPGLLPSPYAQQRWWLHFSARGFLLLTVRCATAD